MRGGEDVAWMTGAELALVTYVRKVTADPTSVEPADIQILRDHGWDNAEIVEALSMALLAAFTNTLAMAMRFDEDIAPLGLSGYF